MPHFEDATMLTYNGWMAVLFSVLSILGIYRWTDVFALGCVSRIASNIRIDAMHHIVKLPLGFAETFGSGKLRKIVNESSAATETYLAHQLPDKAEQLQRQSVCWHSTVPV